MKECVVIDAVHSASARAHNEKGWFRNVRPDELLIKVYNVNVWGGALALRIPWGNPAAGLSSL